jgi:hypothetical protein
MSTQQAPGSSGTGSAGDSVRAAMQAAASLFPTAVPPRSTSGDGSGVGDFNPLPWRLRFIAVRETLKPLLTDQEAAQWWAVDGHRSTFLRHLGGGSSRLTPLLPDSLDGEVTIGAVLTFAMAWTTLEQSLALGATGASTPGVSAVPAAVPAPGPAPTQRPPSQRGRQQHLAPPARRQSSSATSGERLKGHGSAPHTAAAHGNSAAPTATRALTSGTADCPSIVGTAAHAASALAPQRLVTLRSAWQRCCSR